VTEAVKSLEMRGIVKRFPGVVANDGVGIEVRAGEVLAILGENGAGKSTLMKILYGLYRPDAGQILVNGRPVRISCPRDAIALGIGMVHQHFTLVPSLTVAENVVLGLPSGRGPLLDLRAAAQQLRQLSQAYHLPVDPRALVWQLSVGEQQRVEILKLLYRGTSVLVLDEPTAVLSPQESTELMTVLRGMADSGRAIILITHKLQEVMTVSDRVTVLRGGRVVGTLPTSQADAQLLARMMVGAEMTQPSGVPRGTGGAPVLELRRVWSNGDKGVPALRGVSLQVNAGEILGIAGVSGNGQKELAEVAAGLRKVVGGCVLVNGRDVTRTPPAGHIDGGLAYVPEDRITVGTIPSLTVAENVVLKDHHRPPYARWLLLRPKAIRRHACELVRSYEIRTPDVDTPVAYLSGGNLQRLILARELSGNPLALVAAYPTRGLDIRATGFVHRRLLEAKARGTGVLLISHDLDEILSLSDRVAVMYGGEVLAVLPREEADVHRLGLLMAGMRKDDNGSPEIERPSACPWDAAAWRGQRSS
jgi:simple sugar transport system ATP-binding protein